MKILEKLIRKLYEKIERKKKDREWQELIKTMADLNLIKKVK